MPVEGTSFSPVSSPAPVTHHDHHSSSSGASSAGSGASSSDLADVPGVPRSFAACVALRESSNGTNQAYNGGVYVPDLTVLASGSTYTVELWARPQAADTTYRFIFYRNDSFSGYSILYYDAGPGPGATGPIVRTAWC